MNEAAILTENLCKSFGETLAVASLNLRVPQGAVYGFLGRNGAGKTTTMRMLLGLQRATTGRALVLGIDHTREESRSALCHAHQQDSHTNRGHDSHGQQFGEGSGCQE